MKLHICIRFGQDIKESSVKTLTLERLSIWGLGVSKFEVGLIIHPNELGLGRGMGFNNLNSLFHKVNLQTTTPFKFLERSL